MVAGGVAGWGRAVRGTVGGWGGGEQHLPRGLPPIRTSASDDIFYQLGLQVPQRRRHEWGQGGHEGGGGWGGGGLAPPPLPCLLLLHAAPGLSRGAPKLAILRDDEKVSNLQPRRWDPGGRCSSPRAVSHHTLSLLPAPEDGPSRSQWSRRFPCAVIPLPGCCFAPRRRPLSIPLRPNPHFLQQLRSDWRRTAMDGDVPHMQPRHAEPRRGSGTGGAGAWRGRLGKRRPSLCR